MLFFDGGLALVFFAVWVFCIIDVITTSEADCRNLPKMMWLLVVIILADAGSIAWLVAGRNWNAESSSLANKGSRIGGSRRGAPGRPAKGRATSPDDDEDFLAGLRARAEEQRRRARETEQRDEPPAGNPPA